MSNEPFDPWRSGTPAYRVTLVAGMVSTAIGLILVVLALLGPGGSEHALRVAGLVFLAAGILSHLVALGLRRRQAAQILSRRASKDDA